MTKSDLIDSLCDLQKLPKGRAEALVNCVFEAMEEALRRGERIEIRGFGSFEMRDYKSYSGRNPRTGSAVNVKPKRLPFFKVGKELRDRVDEGRLKYPIAADSGQGDDNDGVDDDDNDDDDDRSVRMVANEAYNNNPSGG